MERWAGRFGHESRLAACAWSAAVVLALTACGSRLSYERLQADAGVPVQSAAATAGGDRENPGAAGVPVPGDGVTNPAGEAGGSVETPTEADAALGDSGPEPSGSRATAPRGSTPSAPAARAQGGRPTGGGAAAPRAGGPKAPPAPGASGGGQAPEGPAAGAAPASCSGGETPLKIGTVGHYSGAFGAVLGPGTRAVQAWAAARNAEGGVNCHQVKYVIADDGADPSRQQALVQQLVERDGVIAFVYMANPITGAASVKYLTEKRVPVIGGSAGEGEWVYSSPMHFPHASSNLLLTRAVFAAQGEVARREGKSKLGVIACVEVQACSRAYDLGESYGPEFGMRVVYRAKVSLVQPDYTSECLAARNAGVETMFLGIEVAGSIRLARSCKSVSYQPLYAIISSVATPSVASTPSFDKVAVGEVVMPWMVTSNPGIAEYQAVLKQYAPGVEPGPNPTAGWASAKVFELATKNMAEPPSSQNILAGLWSIKNNDLGGITAPLTFTKDQNAPKVFCYWTVQLVGGQFVSPNGGKRTCK